MTLQEYQEHVAKTFCGESYDRLIASLAEELGEVAQVVKEIRVEGFEPEQELKLTLELGDLIRYAVMLAVRTQIPLETILYENMAKIEKRHPKFFRTNVHQTGQEITSIITNK
ncbi:MAG: MazG nucleotide pyrophosphohydrolase domain-containing protein [Bacillota bacterium]|nr:MazG nucleotide pyrophosphohydrolase domain-containing protein [Bacillota bacterium]